MNQKILLIGLIIILLTGIAVAGVMFFNPYEQDQPIPVDDTDSDPEEIQDVGDENDKEPVSEDKDTESPTDENGEHEADEPVKTDDTGSTPQGVKNVTDASNEFTFDLYSEMNKSEDGNIFYSPYSIFAALAMTYEGARGNTAAEMKSVFHFPEINILRPNFARIYNNINQAADDYELKTGNALWVQKDFSLLEDYIIGIKKYYGGRITNLDFIRETEKSRQTINTYIEKQTNDKIKDLIPQGATNKLTRLVLTNAVYFKGTWEWQFDKDKTYQGNFKITNDNIVKTEMMYMYPDKARFNYADTGDLQILELPYKGDKISMLVLLPSEKLDDIGKNLTAEKLNEYKSQMKETKLDSISIPKFEFDSKYFLEETLKTMGMPAAFSENADFSGITGLRELFISSVIHQAYVKVDEEGTEAAAATGVIMVPTAAPLNIFRADRPFIFLIQEKATGNILFFGRVVDPTK